MNGDDARRNLENANIIPAALIAGSFGNEDRWYRAQGWNGCCTPKKGSHTRRR